MNSISFNIENHIITYETNWLGIETVFVNGQQVSKKLSLPFRKHRFSLDINGKTEGFYIKTKQSFSGERVTVFLHHNDVCIENKDLKVDYSLYFNNSETEQSNNSSLIYATLFLILVIVFDWPKFLLFIALMYVFTALGKNAKTQKEE